MKPKGYLANDWTEREALEYIKPAFIHKVWLVQKGMEMNYPSEILAKIHKFDVDEIILQLNEAMFTESIKKAN